MVHKLAKNEGQYPAIFNEKAWSTNDLLFGFWGHGRTQRVAPSGRDSSLLPAWVANHSTGYGSSCLLMELAI